GAVNEQMPDETEELRERVQSEMLAGAAVELHEQAQRGRHTLAHDRDAEEHTGVAPKQREGGIEDLSRRHRPQLGGSHRSSSAIKMPPRCRTREPRLC